MRLLSRPDRDKGRGIALSRRLHRSLQRSLRELRLVRVLDQLKACCGKGLQVILGSAQRAALRVPDQQQQRAAFSLEVNGWR